LNDHESISGFFFQPTDQREVERAAWRARRRARRKPPAQRGAPRVCAWGKREPGAARFVSEANKTQACGGAAPSESSRLAQRLFAEVK
jgi:hypothetical protein